VLDTRRGGGGETAGAGAGRAATTWACVRRRVGLSKKENVVGPGKLTRRLVRRAETLRGDSASRAGASIGKLVLPALSPSGWEPPSTPTLAGRGGS